MPLKDPEARKKYGAARYVKNRTQVLADAKIWYHANKARAKVRAAVYRKGNAKKINAATKAWRKANRGVWATPLKVFNDQWRAANPKKVKEMQRRAHLKRSYGITPEHVQVILRAQNFTCAIPYCGTPIRKLGHNAGHVDHDHLTNALRGILCARHNKGLGHFHDEPQQLIAGATYLTKNVDWCKILGVILVPRPSGSKVIRCKCGRRCVGKLGSKVTCPGCGKQVLLRTRKDK